MCVQYYLLRSTVVTLKMTPLSHRIMKSLWENGQLPMLSPSLPACTHTHQCRNERMCQNVLYINPAWVLVSKMSCRIRTNSQNHFQKQYIYWYIDGISSPLPNNKTLYNSEGSETSDHLKKSLRSLLRVSLWCCLWVFIIKRLQWTLDQRGQRSLDN